MKEWIGPAGQSDASPGITEEEREIIASEWESLFVRVLWAREEKGKTLDQFDLTFEETEDDDMEDDEDPSTPFREINITIDKLDPRGNPTEITINRYENLVPLQQATGKAIWSFEGKPMYDGGENVLLGDPSLCLDIGTIARAAGECLKTSQPHSRKIIPIPNNTKVN